MKVVIIEDERPAATKLARMLGEIDHTIEIVSVLESVESATNWLMENPNPDLIFMDIQLEDGLCFEIFQHCAIDVPIIFTTAYDAYTLKAFKVNSVDYLLKPIDQSELSNAIEKFHRLHKHPLDISGIEAALQQIQTGIKERFLIKTGERYKSVPVSDIDYFFIEDRCTFLVVGDGKRYLLDYSLDKIEELVDPKIFFRINRSFIINISAIRDMIAWSSSRLKIVLKNWNGGNVLVSRERVKQFKEWMDR